MASSRQEILDAAQRGDGDALQVFFGSDAPPTHTSLEDILTEAARANQPSVVELCLQKGAEVTYEVQQAAHQGGEREVYRLLVPHGLDVNCGFGHAGGPLTEAVQADDLAWVQLLLEHGADPELAPLYGNQAALGVAAANCVSMDIVEALVRGGAATGYKGLLVLAVKAGNVPFVEFILGRGASVDERIEESFFVPRGEGSVLHLAAGLGHVDVVRILVDRGADTSVRDGKGRTALERAVEMGKIDVVKLLEAR